jgi:hypothetical protein
LSDGEESVSEKRLENLMIGDLVRCKDNPVKIGIITEKAIRNPNVLMEVATVFFKIKWFNWDAKHDEHWWMVGMLDTIIKNQKNL